jgi:GTP cyclohydrolase IA
MEDEVRALMRALQKEYNWRFSDDEFEHTPKRFVGMLEEWKQRHEYAKFTKFEPIKYSGMVILGPIHFDAYCSHHLQIFDGQAWVGYIPGTGKVYGASKLARLVERRAFQAQTQERLTQEVIDDIEAKDAMVVMKSRHMCMAARGIKTENGIMTTSCIKGAFKHHGPRMEFLSLAGLA